jgi:hypothetical protein
MRTPRSLNRAWSTAILTGIAGLALASPAASLAGNNFGTWYFSNHLEVYGSRASIQTPAGQTPASGELLLKRVGSQSTSGGSAAGALQVGLVRTNGTDLDNCGSSPSSEHKYVEKKVQGSFTFSCQMFSTSDPGTDVSYSVYRTATSGQWRAEVNGNILATNAMGYDHGLGYMGSEISGAGTPNSSSSDVLYCNTQNWNVFDGTGQGQSVLINSNSDVTKFSPATGWTFGNLPCGVHISH